MAKKTNVEPINMDFSINSLLDSAIAENNPTPDTDETTDTLEAADATFADEATVVTPAPAKKTRTSKAPAPTPAPEHETKVTVEHDFKELINANYVIAEAIKRLSESDEMIKAIFALTAAIKDLTGTVIRSSERIIEAGQLPETTPVLVAPPVVVKPAPVEKEVAQVTPKPAPAKPATPANPIRAKFPDGVGYEDIANECRRIIQEDNLYGRQRVVEIIKALGVNDMKSLPVHRYEEAMTLLMATNK